MKNPDHYTYRVRWSAEDGAFVGTVAELVSLSWCAESAPGALEGIRRMVDDVLQDITSSGEEPPIAPFGSSIGPRPADSAGSED